MLSKLQMSLLVCIVLLAALCYMIITDDKRHNLANSKPGAKHHLTLNMLLHNLRSECLAKDLEIAQNTVLDIRQEWSYLDPAMQKDASYFPSDSIRTLDSLITSLSSRETDIALMQLILKEIKHVNEKLDQLAE